MQSRIKPISARKDKVLVLGSWFGLLLGIRYAIYAITPHWFGGIGAVAISLAILLSLFKMRCLKSYRQKTYNVLSGWYQGKLIRLSLFMTCFAILLLTSALIILEDAQRNFRNVNMEDINPESFTDPFSVIQYAIFRLNLEWGGGLQFMFFAFLGEDVEWLVFVALIRKGILLKAAP